jgi:hypothetical protein
LRIRFLHFSERQNLAHHPPHPAISTSCEIVAGRAQSRARIEIALNEVPPCVE